MLKNDQVFSIPHQFLQLFLLPVVCDNQQFTERRGLVTSPEYPSRYPQNANCDWTISVDKGYQISLTFLEVQHRGCHYTCQQFYFTVQQYLISTMKNKSLPKAQHIVPYTCRGFPKNLLLLSFIYLFIFRLLYIF